MSFLLGLIAVTGCGGGASTVNPKAAGPCSATPAVATATMGVDDFAFEPACIQVPVGTAVTFLNAGEEPNDIAADAAQVDPFDSGLIPSDAAFRHTFAIAGTIVVHSTFYAGMTATVIVGAP